MNPIVNCGDKDFKLIEFDWHMTNWCNFKCSYCPVLNVITNDFAVADHAVAHKMVLARLSKVERPFKMCISGGEPTLNPNLPEILEALVKMDNCINVAIMTNLSRSTAYYKKVSDIGLPYITDINKITVMASYHPEYWTDKFVDKAEWLTNNISRFQITVNLSDNPETWPKTIEVLDVLATRGIKIRPTILSSNSVYTTNYTDDFYTTFAPYLDESKRVVEVACTFDNGETKMMKAHEIERQGLNAFKGYLCTPVYYQINIKGDITNICTNRRVGLSLSDANIVKREVCPRDLCPSRQLLNFYKEKI